MDLSTPEGRQALGLRIQSAIMAAGYDSLPDFARERGWSRALIYQYTSGRVLAQLDRLQEIASATGKSLAWFFAAEGTDDAARLGELQEHVRATDEQLATARADLAADRGQRLADEQRARQTSLALLEELCRAQRRNGDAGALLEAAARLLEVAGQLGDAGAAVRARLHLGHAWFLQGELPRAAAVLREALALALIAGDPATVDSLRQELVRVLVQSGQTAAARTEAAALSASARWWPRWSGQVSLAAIAVQTGEPEVATAALDAAAEVVAEANEPPARRLAAETYILSNRATLALAQGYYRLAATQSTELRSLAARAGAVDQMREADLNLSVVALRRGEIKRAAEQLAMLGEWADLAGDGRLRALVLVFRSEWARRCGHLREAGELARAAMQAATELRQAQVLVEAELALGQAQRARDRREEACYHLERAWHAAEDLQYVRAQLQARLELATLGCGETAARPAWGELLADLEHHALPDLRAEALWRHAPLLDPAPAEAQLGTVVALAKTVGYFWPAYGALLGLAQRRLDADEGTAAARYWQEARALRRARAGRASCPAWTSAERALRAALPPGSLTGLDEQANGETPVTG